MIRHWVGFALFSLSLFAGDAGFNGRWDIDVKTPRGRVWWMEVRGAGTGKVEGSFVGAPGGQLDEIRSMKIEGGELTFSFELPPSIKQRYFMRLVDGKIQGRREEWVDGKASPELPFTGWRAPVLTDRDDGSWKPGRTVALFDGKSVDGWSLVVPGRPVWYAEDGLLKNNKGAGDLMSAAKFWNFELEAEYRYPKGSNSGINLRGRYEVQISDDFAEPASKQGHGALYSRIVPSVNASKAPGEWQTMRIRLIGPILTVTLNGTKVIDRRDVVGPTAMVMSPFEDTPGPIVLQGDHGPVEFRRLQVTELVQR